MRDVDLGRPSPHVGTLRLVRRFEGTAGLAARTEADGLAISETARPSSGSTPGAFRSSTVSSGLRASWTTSGWLESAMLDEIAGERPDLVHLADVPPGIREDARDDGRLPPGKGQVRCGRSSVAS